MDTGNFSNEKLLEYGYELCEFNDTKCDDCGEIPEINEDLFWISTNYEIIEGDYVCRKCATKRIEDDSMPYYETGNYYR